MTAECEHETVVDHELVGGILHGACAECGAPMAETGPEDESGEPGWEPTEAHR